MGSRIGLRPANPDENPEQRAIPRLLVENFDGAVAFHAQLTIFVTFDVAFVSVSEISGVESSASFRVSGLAWSRSVVPR